MKIKDNLQGLGQVFRFTLTQMLKSKANIISLIIAFVVSAALVPVSGLMGDGVMGIHDPACGVERLYVDNRTELDLDGLESFIHADAYFAGVKVLTSGYEDGEGNLLLTLRREDGTDRVTIHWSDEDNIGLGEASELFSALITYAKQQRLFAAGMTEEQWQQLNSGVKYEVRDMESLGQEEYHGYSDSYANISLFYSMAVMMISILAIGFIIRSVVEEKTSKLVDLLMVSVKPMALLCGKILAVILYTLINVLLMGAGYTVSYLVCRNFMDVSHLSGIFGGVGALFSGNMWLTLAAVLVSLVIGVLTFCMLGGVCGAGCSTMEDTSSANSVPMLLIMAGYFAGVVVNAAGLKLLARIFSLVPICSVFVAPLAYASGTIGYGTVVLSWLLQLLLLVLMIWLSARVYSSLVIYKGKRLSFLSILKLAFGKEVK